MQVAVGLPTGAGVEIQSSHVFGQSSFSAFRAHRLLIFSAPFFLAHAHQSNVWSPIVHVPVLSVQVAVGLPTGAGVEIQSSHVFGQSSFSAFRAHRLLIFSAPFFLAHAHQSVVWSPIVHVPVLSAHSTGEGARGDATGEFVGESVGESDGELVDATGEIVGESVGEFVDATGENV